MSRITRRFAASLAPGTATVVLASAATLGSAAPASAAEDDLHIDLPAGLACSFGLTIDGVDSKRITRQFTDANGNLVRVLTAGKGYQLTFANTSTGASVTLPANGSVTRTTFNSDGTMTVQSTGHNVIILFPTDVPSGPSTTLYVGRVTYTVSADGVFTLSSVSGRTTDVCALLTE